MQEPSAGMGWRLLEKVLGWIILGLLVAAAYGIYAMGPQGRASLWAGIWKTLVWIIVAAALPWSGRLFIRRILEIGSNWAGVALLVAYALVDAAVGLLLLGGWPRGTWSWIAATAAWASAGTYNFLVSQYLSEQAGG
jgi:hypothetical protein